MAFDIKKAAKAKWYVGTDIGALCYEDPAAKDDEDYVGEHDDVVSGYEMMDEDVIAVHHANLAEIERLRAAVHRLFDTSNLECKPPCASELPDKACDCGSVDARIALEKEVDRGSS